MALTSNQIQAKLASGILATVADNVFTQSAPLMLTLSKSKPWNTGRTLDKTVELFEQGNVQSFSNADLLNTNLADTERKASFDFRQVSAPVVIIGGERDAYATASTEIKATEDLLALAIDRAKANLTNKVAEYFYGDGTGNSNKDFLGALAAADDGSAVTTYGNLSRTTYANWQGNRFAPGAGLTDLDDIAQAMSAATHGVRQPDLIATTPALYDDLEAVYTPSLNQNYGVPEVRITPQGIGSLSGGGLQGQFGFTGMKFRGATVVADENATTNYMYLINTGTFNFYGLESQKEGAVTLSNSMDNIESPYDDSFMRSGGMGISFTGMQSPTNQYTEVGHLLMQGNFVTFSPRDHAVIIFS